MNKARIVALLVAGMASPTASAADLGMEAILGGQLLELRSDGLSGTTHVNDEIALGRTLLGGLSVGLQVGRRHFVAAEAVFGPYRNDIERACVIFLDPCSPTPLFATDFAVLYGLHYSLLLADGDKSPFVGFGLGAKSYNYDEAVGGHQRSTSATLHLGLGFEFGGRAPLRLEVRGVVVPNNPYLAAPQGVEGGGYDSATQFELQLRASIRLTARR